MISIKKKRKEQDKVLDKIKKIFKIIKNIILSLLLLCIIGGVVGTGCIYINYKDRIDRDIKEANEKFSNINKGTFLSKLPTVIYDKDGNELVQLSQYNSEYLKDEDIKSEIKNAVISIEDKRYFEHMGIDIKALTRAGMSLIVNKGKITQGGSTITQQLAKNVFLTNEQSFDRKIKEMILAIKLEKNYSKDKILCLYLNNIYYGHSVYGIESASKFYFGKSSKDLNVSQIAFLTAIPNNPTLYDPYTNFDNTIKRRNIILNEMYNQGYISKEKYNEAKEYEIQLVPEKKIDNSINDNYMASYAIYCATLELMSNDGFSFKNNFDSNEERESYMESYNEEYKKISEDLKTGGYKIYTSLDPIKQSQLQDTLNRNMEYYYTDVNSETGLYNVQGASVCIDNNTGLVVAIVGGRTQPNCINEYNRAFLAVRQPGSAIKPLVAYAPAIDHGYTANSYVEDSYIENGPKNYSRGYSGTVSLRYAVETSINTIPFKLVTQLGTKNCLDYLFRLDFKNIIPEDKQSPIVSIGGFTNGVTPVEMAGGYSALARGGKYSKVTCLTSIYGYDDKPIYKNYLIESQVYTVNTAHVMTNMLKGVINSSNGTGRKMKLNTNIPTAGKTGTTDSYKDAWFCGYTPYYTTVVYVGADTPKTLDGLVGGGLPGEIWRDYMNTIHDGLDYKDFN